MDPQPEVLGLNYFGPVSGSPLLPPEVVTFYFILAFILIAGAYIWLHRKRKPAGLWPKFKLFLAATFFVKLFLILGIGGIAAYWLLPQPNIQETSPVNTAVSFPISQKIEIIFDRPVSRSSLEKSITPEIPGVWVFENSLYTTHFYRKLVFHPTTSLKPDTEYKITLSNVKNALKISDSQEFNLTFKTQSSPKIQTVEPVSGTEQVNISSPIIVKLSSANDKVSEFEFELKPPHPIEAKLSEDKTTYTLLPKEPLKQGTKYELSIKKTDLTFNLPTNTIVERKPSSNEYLGSFTTKEAPGVKHFSPTGTNIPLNSKITINFSESMDQKSVEEHLMLEPKTNMNLNWTDEQTLVITANSLKYDTNYSIKLTAGTKALSSGFISEDITKTFTTIGPVRVASISPKDKWSAVATNTPIKITFDQEVDQTSAESKFSISPEVPGSFSWNENTLIFTPSSPLPFSSSYTTTINPGVKSKSGQDSTQTFSASFTTQEQTVKLAVPAYLQQRALSCELAALRMALAYRGVSVSEDQLLNQVGLDPTPHNGNVWGNPHQAFVGNVNGKQMADGYGVHWQPIAKVARMYTGAQDFEGWGIEQLTQALASGNPVVIWVYSSGGWPTSWNTPGGQNIYAVRDEHAVTAVGFVGPAQNPSSLIINDPLYGQVYWQRSLFDKKWGIFNRSGVVVL